jgi:hypothetical protein
VLSRGSVEFALCISSTASEPQDRMNVQHSRRPIPGSSHCRIRELKPIFL